MESIAQAIIESVYGLAGHNQGKGLVCLARGGVHSRVGDEISEKHRHFVFGYKALEVGSSLATVNLQIIACRGW